MDFQLSEFRLGGDREDRSGVQVVLVDRKTFAAQLGATFKPLPGARLQPFVVGGVGYFSSEYTSDNRPRDRVDDTGTYLGGGLELMGPRFGGGSASFILEGRRLFTREEYDGVEAVADGFSVTLGARIHF